MVVVDTSIIYKWYAKQEPYFEQAYHLLEQHITKKEELIAPDLILYELANAWATKTQVSQAQAQKNLQNLKEVQLSLISNNFELVEKAISFAKEYKVTVYDATYAVLAMEKKCDLITADEKFVKKINLEFIKSLHEHI